MEPLPAIVESLANEGVACLFVVARTLCLEVVSCPEDAVDVGAADFSFFDSWSFRPGNGFPLFGRTSAFFDFEAPSAGLLAGFDPPWFPLATASAKLLALRTVLVGC